MKKYRFVTSPSLILYTLWPVIVWSSLCAFLTLIDPDPSDAFIWLMVPIMWFIAFIFYREAYCIFEINEFGVKNRRLTIPWEDIYSFSLERVVIFERNLKKEVPSIIWISSTKMNDTSLKSSKKCVKMSMSKKNLEMLKYFSNGKSKTVDEFVDKYIVIYK